MVWRAILVALLVACGGEVDPLSDFTPSDDTVDNVLIIAIDTFRADRAALCADQAPARDLVPHLRREVARGTCFDTAIAQAPWTMPSFGSALSGRYPRQHGGISLEGAIPAETELLPDVLGAAGWQTAAVISHKFVHPDRGFTGWQYVDDTQVRGHGAITSDQIATRALHWLDRERDPEQPFVLFTHWFDPHYKYKDHAMPWADGYRGWARRELHNMTGLRHKRHLLESRDVGFLLDRYDEEVAYTDAQVGRLLEGLRERGLADDTAIVIVGDHGEEFMEHGWLGHTITLHDEVIRVPMALILPGQTPPGHTVEAPVETRALYGTLLDYLEQPHGGAASLLPVAQGTAPAPEPVFSSAWLPDAKPRSGKRVTMVSARTDRFKVIEDYTHRRLLGYDLQADPGEQRPLDVESHGELSALYEHLSAWDAEVRASAAEGGTYELSEQEREQLEALGYL